MKVQGAAVQHDRQWLITGATGFIGREFVRALLQRGEPGNQIFLIVRGKQGVTSRDRLFAALAPILDQDAIHSLQVVDGDVRNPHFGLDAEDWNRICESSHLVHLAANTSFTATIQEARECNLLGTREMAQLARECRDRGNLKHWSHVSTAYVVGDRTDLIHPGDLRSGTQFRNCYEQSKNESEHFLKPCLTEFPLTVFRPSIVVGHSRSGAAGNFNTIYWAIRSYLSGQMKLYARGDTPLDLVPVDYVVDAMLALIDRPMAHGMTLHLAGGKSTTISLLEFAHKICAYLDSPLPDIQNPARLKILCRLLSFARLSAKRRRFIDQAQSYLPYFCQNPQFDIRLTETLLRDSNVAVPQLDQYLPNILNYCLEQPWGRRSPIPGTGYGQKNVAHG
ncbi:MAG: SDR family oxidoreductase [Acidiferrobacterales bacterium]|nr:SDR family oxidoreductase [Acidiferrobacterales bacterium]